jgi:hypothetical protein
MSGNTEVITPSVLSVISADPPLPAPHLLRIRLGGHHRDLAIPHTRQPDEGVRPRNVRRRPAPLLRTTRRRMSHCRSRRITLRMADVPACAPWASLVDTVEGPRPARRGRRRCAESPACERESASTSGWTRAGAPGGSNSECALPAAASARAASPPDDGRAALRPEPRESAPSTWRRSSRCSRRRAQARGRTRHRRAAQ